MTGMKHPNIPCGGANCSVIEICGIRWQCTECQMNLCSGCFFAEIPHDANHRLFKRYDNSGITEPPVVSCWSEDGVPSDRIKLLGCYPGAQVAQGAELTHDKRGYDYVGSVQSDPKAELQGEILVNWIMMDLHRQPDKVDRRHLRGHRDLRIVEPGIGGVYHPDALPSLVSNDPSLLPYSSPSSFHELELSALHIACKQGQKDVVQSLLNEANIEMDAADINGFRAVHYAVLNNEVNILKMLMAKGAQLDCHNHSGKTALQIAVSNQFTECYRLLIDDGCDVNLEDLDGDTALHNAIHDGRVPEIILSLASSGRINWKLRNKLGFNVLHIAVMKNNIKAVQIILDNADQDLVLERIADTRVTVLHYACSRSNFPLAKVLVDHVRGISSVPTLLLQTFLDAKNCHGRTALFFPGEFYNYDLLELLIQAGADLNAKDSNDDTLLGMVLVSANVPPPSKELCPSIYEDGNFNKFMIRHPEYAIVGYLLDRGIDWNGGREIMESLMNACSDRSINILHKFALKCRKKCSSNRRIVHPHVLPDDYKFCNNFQDPWKELEHLEDMLIWKEQSNHDVSNNPALSDYVFEWMDEGEIRPGKGFLVDQFGIKYIDDSTWSRWSPRMSFECVKEGTSVGKRKCEAFAEWTTDRIDGTVTIRLKTPHQHRVP